jgi:hypothetical protein
VSSATLVRCNDIGDDTRHILHTGNVLLQNGVSTQTLFQMNGKRTEGKNSPELRAGADTADILQVNWLNFLTEDGTLIDENDLIGRYANEIEVPVDPCAKNIEEHEDEPEGAQNSNRDEDWSSVECNERKNDKKGGRNDDLTKNGKQERETMVVRREHLAFAGMTEAFLDRFRICFESKNAHTFDGTRRMEVGEVKGVIESKWLIGSWLRSVSQKNQ